MNKYDAMIEAMHMETARQKYRIMELERVLKGIVTISDRKHNLWDEAKELLKKASEK